MYVLCSIQRSSRNDFFRTFLKNQALHTLARLRNHLIVVFGYEYVCSNCDEKAVEQHDDPADSAENPGFVQLPTNEEAVVVVVKVGLRNASVYSFEDIPAHWLANS
jgi:hypothetical protein